MKEKLEFGFAWVLLSALMLMFWIIGLMVGNAIFPSSIMEASEDAGGLREMFVVCLVNTMALLILVYRSNADGLKLFGVLVLLIFGVQSFMSQIETLWFNEAIKFPLEGLKAVILSGFIVAVSFSGAAVWMTRNRRSPNRSREPISFSRGLIFKIALLAILVYPALYFLAGYFIAWQFEAVRIHYAGISEQTGFLPIMKENIASGLYFFQIFRGLLWIGIAVPALKVLVGTPVEKGLIIGLLFALLMSMGLIIPNPFMPDAVRLAHFLEITPSNFLWGFLIAWTLEAAVHTKGYQAARDMGVKEG